MEKAVTEHTTDLHLDVVWPRLIAIADEMATTLFRTAFSHDVVEVHDMSTGLYDERGNLIGQTWLGATGHTGVMPVFGKNLLAAFPPETVRQGDVFICNDPWLCNGQTADVFITTPAFLGERLIGFSINSVHHVDIGGRKGSGLSEEVYEEGLIIPPLRLYAAGQPNDDLFALLRRNVRFSEKMIGDLRAQVAAGWIGAGALEKLAREFELASLRPVADEIIRRTEAGMRAGIAALPDGRYHKELAMEIAGIDEPQTIALTVTIEGDRLTADFTGTAPQVRCPVNSPINYTRAYVAVPVKIVCDPLLPNNEGTYRPLRLVVPDGCLVNPTYPAPCFWRLAAGMLVSELMFRILCEIAPDRVPADSGSMPTWQFYVNGVRRGGEAFALHQHAFGGMGARPGADGLASVSFPYNVRDVSVEWSELETPLMIERRELIADSGGAGQWRGGLGEELVLRAVEGKVDPAKPIVLSGSAGRMRFAPEGLFGAGPGALGRIEVNGTPIAPSSSPEVTLRVGDVVRLLLPGGGGHGDPRRRERALIERDLANGYVTPEAARLDYGYEGGTAC
jgi:N-methylhydantoinase B